MFCLSDSLIAARASLSQLSLQSGTSIESGEQRATWPSWIILTVNSTHLEANAYRRIKAPAPDYHDTAQADSHGSNLSDDVFMVATPHGKVFWKIERVFRFGVDGDGKHYGDSLEYIQNRNTNL